MFDKPTRDQLVAGMKNLRAFARQVSIRPPIGLEKNPVIIPSQEGMTTYFYILGQALAGDINTELNPDGDSFTLVPSDVARRAIDITDAVFLLLGMKFDLGEEAPEKRQ